MSSWGVGPFESDVALDFLALLEGSPQPGAVIESVLDAILSEDNYIPDMALVFGLAAVGAIGSSFDSKRGSISLLLSNRVRSYSGSQRLKWKAANVVECARHPWGLHTGCNSLYWSHWQTGDLAAYLDVLHSMAIKFSDLPPPASPPWIPHPKPPSVLGRFDDHLASFPVPPVAPAFRIRYGSEDVAKAVHYAILSVIEGIHHDAKSLACDETVLRSDLTRLRQLNELPWRYASMYDQNFALKMLSVASLRADSVLRGLARRPRCVAEQLVDILFSTAGVRFIAERSNLSGNEFSEACTAVREIFNVTTRRHGLRALLGSSCIRQISEITSLVPSSLLPLPGDFAQAFDRWFRAFEERPGLYSSLSDIW
ncbi:DUF4259 domain-containing protein [Nonomuraea sp. NPDC050310]|uniref:DUF4259 domain-containing protein n=1 Tax=unclassified Nonomuraea TaxID=2593643 RepID=UPI0033DA95AE